ncbi:MAG: hypothetical protein ACJA01_002465 [Saprospiraceae bacterium]|jgi:hypothetical protein
MSRSINKEVAGNIRSAANLELKARNLARGMNMGKQHSLRIGGGMEFDQYKNYVQGDDIRLLDWKMYAKTQQYYIRQSKIESNSCLHVILDDSKSMSYEEEGKSKIGIAKIITATLSYVIVQQGDQFGWQAGKSIFAKGSGLKNWRRSLLQLENLNMDSKTLSDHVVRIDGIQLWITDLYMELSKIEQFVTSCASRNSELVIFHLIGRNEESLDFKNNSKFLDLESGEKLHVNAKKYSKRYQNALNLHLFQVKRICQRKGIVYKKIYLQSELKLELQLFLKEYNAMRSK